MHDGRTADRLRFVDADLASPHVTGLSGCSSARLSAKTRNRISCQGPKVGGAAQKNHDTTTKPRSTVLPRLRTVCPACAGLFTLSRTRAAVVRQLRLYALEQGENLCWNTTSGASPVVKPSAKKPAWTQSAGPRAACSPRPKAPKPCARGSAPAAAGAGRCFRDAPDCAAAPGPRHGLVREQA